MRKRMMSRTSEIAQGGKKLCHLIARSAKREGQVTKRGAIKRNERKVPIELKLDSVEGMPQ